VLAELHVRGLGVIAELELAFGPGMSAITGETGAGKTLLVQALGLLAGQRAEGSLVRDGEVALIEGRFFPEIAGGRRDADRLAATTGLGTERVLARELAPGGRGRAWLDGRLSTLGALGEEAPALFELVGQHAHQALARREHQRAALDRFAGIDGTELEQARAELRRRRSALEKVGSDPAERERRRRRLAAELAELERAGLDDPGEDEALEAEQRWLADALRIRSALEAARVALVGADDGVAGGGASSAVAHARALVAGVPGAERLVERLEGVGAELADVEGEVRLLAERAEADPERLEAVLARRRQLADLRRRWGPTLEDVIAERERLRMALAELEGEEEGARRLEDEVRELARRVERLERARAEARRRAAPELSERVEQRLGALALGGARFEVRVADDEGAGVELLLAANPGEPARPLARVASGGELARVTLALRLALGDDEGRSALVFDEVDAGIGGQAARAVGEALAELAEHRQVLVVTHLAAVAAAADAHVVVTKAVIGGRTVVSARPVSGAEREAEVARMLSGDEGEGVALAHARTLLAGGRAR